VTLVNVCLKKRTHGLTSDSVTIFYVTDELLITTYIDDITLSSVVIFIIMCKTQGYGIWGTWGYRTGIIQKSSRGSSVSTVSDYGLDDRGLILGKGRGFFL
jgi:hypothetical protein